MSLTRGIEPLRTHKEDNVGIIHREEAGSEEEKEEKEEKKEKEENDVCYSGNCAAPFAYIEEKVGVDGNAPRLAYARTWQSLLFPPFSLDG